MDVPTEVGYSYRKTEFKQDANSTETEFDQLPNLKSVIIEKAGGFLEKERLESQRKGVLQDLFAGNKPKYSFFGKGTFPHSGDGSVPYLSLSYAQTWLLHATRAVLYSGDGAGQNPLDAIGISHRPKGETEWKDGPRPRLATILLSGDG